MSRGKIALGFYQVIGEFLTSLHEVNWSKALTFVGNLTSLIELNVLRIFIRPQYFHDKLKVNPKTEFVIGLSFPVAMILFLFVIYWILGGCYVYKRRFSAVFQNLQISLNCTCYVYWVRLFLTKWNQISAYKSCRGMCMLSSCA
ncbi:hypothetical protein HOLleu_02223 [Holothuria leucospilota]|uniref:Uncharacterized protein n=1 Tax=Holothuria leucospilota TaxID=206669 RepID=A0A9Q1CQ10_HOLLE|nr:hypothetical protein HOLleu_02223 [Holothuria leucospilota]